MIMVKGVRTNSIDNARLAYSWIPDQNEFESGVELNIVQCWLTSYYINLVVIEIFSEGALPLVKFERSLAIFVILVYSFICVFELH